MAAEAVLGAAPTYSHSPYELRTSGWHACCLQEGTPLATVEEANAGQECDEQLQTCVQSAIPVQSR